MPSDKCNNLCRLCLAKDQILIPIFDPLQDTSHDSQIIDKIRVCLPVQINKEDSFSKQICEACLFKVEEFFEFRNSTANCQRLLVLESSAKNSRDEVPQKERRHGIIRNFTSESSEISASLHIKEETEENELIGSVVEESEEEDVEVEEKYQGSLHSLETNSVTAEVTISGRTVDQEVVSNSQNNSTTCQQEDTLDRCTENENHQSNTSPVQCSNSMNISDDTNPIKKQVQLSVELKKSKEYTCSDCGKKFNNNDKFCRHTAIHNKLYNCSECTYTSKYLSNFKIHMMKHKGEFLVMCNVCNKGFYNILYYNDHYRLKHSNEISPYKCEVCANVYYSKINLKQHLRTHRLNNGNDRYQCEICGKICLSYKGLRKHHLTLHEECRYKCDICGKMVTSLQSLKYHQSRHKREKTHVCDICGKAFVGKSSLLVHKRVHSGERPFKCDQCERCFTQKITMIIHKRQHSGERPYHCMLCDKTYACKTNLNRHKKTHEAS